MTTHFTSRFIYSSTTGGLERG